MRKSSSEAGLTLLELAFVLTVVGLISVVALPATKKALQDYQLSAAVSAVTGAIQTTRYQAIMQGYHYNVAFNSGTQTYQVASKIPPAATFSNVGNPVAWSAVPGISITAATTLEFFPGGTVTATTGALNFNITNGQKTETVTVSGVGDVTVSP